MKTGDLNCDYSIQKEAGNKVKNFIIQKAKKEQTPFFDYNQKFAQVDWWVLVGAKILKKLGLQRLDRPNLEKLWGQWKKLTKCPICHGQKIGEPIYNGISRIETCFDCSHRFQNPQLILPYTIKPFPSLLPPNVRPIGTPKTYKMLENLDYIETSLKENNLWNKNTNIIDVGCGQGELAIELVARGYPGQIYGYDPDGEAIKIAQKSISDLKIHTISLVLGSLEDLIKAKKLGPNLIGAFIVSKTLEHLPDPSQTILTMVKTLQKKGVILIIEIPNHNHDSILENLFKGKFYSYWPEHLHYFTIRSLTSLVKNHPIIYKLDRSGDEVQMDALMNEFGMEGWMGSPSWENDKIKVDEKVFVASLNANYVQIKNFFKLHSISASRTFKSYKDFLDLLAKVDYSGYPLLNMAVTKLKARDSAK